MLPSTRSGERIFVATRWSEGKHSYPRDGLLRVTSLRRADLEGQTCAAVRLRWALEITEQEARHCDAPVSRTSHCDSLAVLDMPR